MNSYPSLNLMFHDVLHTVLEYGDERPSRDGHTTEVLAWTGRLDNPRANFLTCPVRRINPSYAAAELIWILSGQRVISPILPYAPQYMRFADEGTLFLDDRGLEPNMANPEAGFSRVMCQQAKYAHGAYGARLTTGHKPGETPLDMVCELLRKDPETRQAVISIHNTYMDLPKAARGNQRDIPCTLTLNFIIRDGKLNLLVNMRSNDAWLGLPHDVFVFTCIQMLVASELGVELGWYQHSATSMHLYSRNEEKAKAAKYVAGDQTIPWDLTNPINMNLMFARMCDIERKVRTQHADPDVLSELAAHTSYSIDEVAINMVAIKWLDADAKHSAIARLPEPLKTYAKEYWSC